MGTKKVGGTLFSYFLVLGFAALFALSVFGCGKKSEGTKTETSEEKPCPVWFKDVDKDGYTDGTTKVSCEQPTGYVSQALAGDCNDDDKNLNPNTVWFKDVDKDGYTDGTTKVSCVKPSDEYVLSASLLDCNDNDPNINPGKMEICDGKDNDCDGQTDEGFNVGQSCSVGLGECARTGQYVCKADGFGTECNAVAGAPSLEICDGKDNDCNGQIDENLTRACYTGPSGTQGVGECRAGIQICTNGVWGTCQGEVLPQSEICDGKDNDCNGQIDEGAKLVFYKDLDGDGYTDGTTQVGCSAPSGYVSSATSGDCNDNDPNINPGKTEICDGKDNNCNGQIDEGVLLVFYKDKDGDGYGDVNDQTLACSQPTGYVSNSSDCNDNDPNVSPGKTEICDGKDNNCDGQTDEGFNVGQSCTVGVGECARTGQYVCKADGSGTQCNATPGTPTAEICDNKDNDCDGQTDEDYVCSHLGDVVWLEGANPQNHSVLVENSTYDFSIYLSYNIATTSSAIIEFSLITTGYSWLGSVTYVVSGGGQVQLTLPGITIPPNVTILGEVRLLDLNWNPILPWWGAPTLSYVSSSTSSVFYVWIKDENPQRGEEFQEGQTVTITLNVEYNALSEGYLYIVALSVEGQEYDELDSDFKSVSGQGSYQFTLTFNVPSCQDSIYLIAYMLSPTFTAYEVAVYPVRLTGSCLRVKPASLYFEVCEGGFPPPPENVYIASTISHISASLTPSKTWITVNPSSGSTPFMSSIGVNTTGLSGGSYYGEVTVSSSNANNSKTIGVSLNIIPASSPTGVIASSMLNSIQISWNEISGVDGYYVYRAINSGGPYTRISGLIPSWFTSYLDLDVQCGVTYYYVVSATSSCGEFLSSEVSAQVEPQPEICDGLDNNCDGQIDEGLTDCYSAIYNPDFGAPLCRSYVSPCSSGALLTGRDNTLFNPERNQPNTLDGCPDGTSYWWIESLEAVTLTSSHPSGNFVAGGEVTVEFVAWCGSTSDYLDVYYASGVTIGENPNWQYLSTYQCTSSWALETFSHTFNLHNTSGYHAVRGVFRYQGSSASCPTGDWDEADDIVFPVQ
jgi:hypothetical protein